MANANTHWSDMMWHKEPKLWSVDDAGTLHATSDEKTDFWQQTFYGFERDDGHALLAQRTGDFSAVLTLEGDYKHLYDQAGLMMRLGPTAWIKFGIEWTDGATNLSVVVTNGVSDWSAQPVVLNGAVTLRMTRLGSAVFMQYRNDDSWQMARLAPLQNAPSVVGIGPYLCSPERQGFRARFLRLTLTDPQVTKLHA